MKPSAKAEPLPSQSHTIDSALLVFWPQSSSTTVLWRFAARPLTAGDRLEPAVSLSCLTCFGIASLLTLGLIEHEDSLLTVLPDMAARLVTAEDEAAPFLKLPKTVASCSFICFIAANSWEICSNFCLISLFSFSQLRRRSTSIYDL